MGTSGSSPEDDGLGPFGEDVEVALDASEGRWTGWGCSLAWCGKALGSSQEAAAWAELLCSVGDVELGSLWPAWAGRYAAPAVPGLGLNVLRYNVGGCGPSGAGLGEAASHKSRGWYAEIEGFQPEPGDLDWSRDAEQRRLLELAVAAAEGSAGQAEVELFANAPMWWMTEERSSFGGCLSCPDLFAAYLAEVALTARQTWQWPVVSVAPFNEPSAGWWRYPHDQEGCNLSTDQQIDIVIKLRQELDQRGLTDVRIAASDENQFDTAVNTWEELRSNPLAKCCVGQLNVHAYKGLDAWREASNPGIRSVLRRMASEDGLPVWMSEHGNGEESGMELAQTILEDLHYLRPRAWCYWQLVEHHCTWGVVEADFKQEHVAAAMLPHPKYYVFAHFTRFVRPGFLILRSASPWVLAAYSPEDAKLVCICVNRTDKVVKRSMKLKGFSTPTRPITATVTEPRRRCFFVERPLAQVRRGEPLDAEGRWATAEEVDEAPILKERSRSGHVRQRAFDRAGRRACSELVVEAPPASVLSLEITDVRHPSIASGGLDDGSD